MEGGCSGGSPVNSNAEWVCVSPNEAGFDPVKLGAVKSWPDTRVGARRYGVVIIRGGRLVAGWNRGLGGEAQLPLASAAKSVSSCLLDIAIGEGKLPSADAKVADYYPEAMDVP